MSDITGVVPNAKQRSSMCAEFVGKVTGIGVGDAGVALEVRAEYRERSEDMPFVHRSNINMTVSDLAKFRFGQQVRVTVEAVEEGRDP